MRSLKLEPKKRIDFDTLTKLAATIASEPKTHSGLCVTMSEAPLGTGMAFMADRAFATNSKPGNGFAIYFLSQAESAFTSPETTAAVTMTWTSGNGRGTPVIWTHDGTKIVPPDAATLEKFREAMAAWDQPESKPISIFLSVLHRDDLKKLAKLNHRDDSEDSDSSDEESSNSIPVLPPP